MKLKFLVFLSALLVVFSTTSKSQTNVYHPFPDSNALWRVSYEVEVFMGGLERIDIQHLIKETFIKNGQKYIVQETKIRQQSYFYKGLDTLFEDGKRIYIYSNNKLLLCYDFNLGVGDTLKRFNREYAVVSKIDSILMDNSYRKVQSFQLNRSFNTIEGIGSTGGMFEHIYEAEKLSNKFCFNQNGKTVYNLGGDCSFMNVKELANEAQRT